MARRPKAPRKVNYQLIPAQSDHGKPLYALLRDIIDSDHEDLRDARFVLAWYLAWKPDDDGVVKLGETRKASDLDRELSAYDFVILLSRPFWFDEQANDDVRRAVLDYFVCYAEVKRDRHGEPILDDRGRVVYRKRKEDIRGFHSNANRYGAWTLELGEFARALAATRPARVAQQADLRVADCADCGGTSYVDIVATDGVTRVKRCHCWTEARAIRANALEPVATIQ